MGIIRFIVTVIYGNIWPVCIALVVCTCKLS